MGKNTLVVWERVDPPQKITVQYNAQTRSTALDEVSRGPSPKQQGCFFPWEVGKSGSQKYVWKVGVGSSDT